MVANQTFTGRPICYESVGVRRRQQRCVASKVIVLLNPTTAEAAEFALLPRTSRDLMRCE